VADVLDEQMVEAHLAKLVDDDRSVRERRIFQKSIEKRCLSGAEKARQHGQWNRCGRSISLGGRRGFAHCVVALTFGFVGLGGFALFVRVSARFWRFYTSALPP